MYNDKSEDESVDDRIIFMITSCNVMANSGNILHEKLLSDESGMEKAIESFLNDHNKGAFRWLRTKLRENSEINAEFEEMLKKQNKKRGNFFTRLFKRNK